MSSIGNIMLICYLYNLKSYLKLNMYNTFESTSIRTQKEPLRMIFVKREVGSIYIGCILFGPILLVLSIFVALGYVWWPLWMLIIMACHGSWLCMLTRMDANYSDMHWHVCFTKRTNKNCPNVWIYWGKEPERQHQNKFDKEIHTKINLLRK